MPEVVLSSPFQNSDSHERYSNEKRPSPVERKLSRRIHAPNASYVSPYPHNAVPFPSTLPPNAIAK